MTRIFAVGTALALLLASAGAGYRWVAGLSTHPAMAQTQDHDHSATQKADGNVLYWKHPDGIAEFSPAPCEDQGRPRFHPRARDEERPSRLRPGRKRGGKRRPQDPLLPQSDGTAGHVADAEKGLDGDGLYPRLRRRDQGGSSVTVSLDKVRASGRAHEARMVQAGAAGSRARHRQAGRTHYARRFVARRCLHRKALRQRDRPARHGGRASVPHLQPDFLRALVKRSRAPLPA